MARHGDRLLRFLFEEADVRGVLVRLEQSWRTVAERRPLPAPARDLLGELCAAGMLLSSSLKQHGSLTFQLTGDGPAQLLVVECTGERTLRGMARIEGEVTPGPLSRVAGTGQVVITAETDQGERYQGIAPLAGDDLATTLEEHLQRSEQLATRLWLAADGKTAAGLMLQRMPVHSGQDQDGWSRLTQLGATVTRKELLELDPSRLLRRLFHEETVRLFDPEPVRFHCGCSHERVTRMLQGLGYAEVSRIIEADNAIEVTCEFCGQNYRFNRLDAERLFAPVTPEGLSSTRH